MKVLVIGSGAREHALVWKISGDDRVTRLYCAPGNAGIAHTVDTPVPTTPDQADTLAAWAQDEEIDLTIVGPEAALAAGVVDAFRAHNLRVVGPTAAAARIETSKTFAKDFMARHGIPTAPFSIFSTPAAARAYLAERSDNEFPLVLKADGLAAGKGVAVVADRRESEAALTELAGLANGAGSRFVIEEFLVGIELSVFALTDGTTVLPFSAARDYKRLGAGNSGPMTGGMGAYSPPAIATDELMATVQRDILEPTVRGMAQDGTPYTGILYAGLMVTRDGPYVVEFNARFGDPETQCILPRLRSSLLELLEHTADGTLATARPVWYDEACCGIVVASGGYPGVYETGYGITGLGDIDAEALVFQAATAAPYAHHELANDDSQPAVLARRPGLGTLFGGGRGTAERLDRQGQQAAQDPYAGVVTAGGRVLTVVALGKTVDAARARAYRNAERIHFTDSYYRPDIAADDAAAIP